MELSVWCVMAHLGHSGVGLRSRPVTDEGVITAMDGLSSSTELDTPHTTSTLFALASGF